MKRIVSQDDLDLNPELVEQGVKVGDEIELGPPYDENGNELNEVEGEEGGSNENEDGPGDSQPPGSQPGKP